MELTMTTKKLSTPSIWRDQLERANAVRQTTEDEQEMEDASEQFWNAIEGITARSCTTPESLAVKARAVRRALAPEIAHGGSGMKLLQSLLDDLDPDGAWMQIENQDAPAAFSGPLVAL
jgi:hypothetical protein